MSDAIRSTNDGTYIFKYCGCDTKDDLEYSGTKIKENVLCNSCKHYYARNDSYMICDRGYTDTISGFCPDYFHN